MKFIYIFKEDVAKEMEARGYALLKKDEGNNVYIFENNFSGNLNFASEDFCYSDILTF